jgi:hypothetical protein
MATSAPACCGTGPGYATPLVSFAAVSILDAIDSLGQDWNGFGADHVPFQRNSYSPECISNIFITLFDGPMCWRSGRYCAIPTLLVLQSVLLLQEAVLSAH